MEEGHGSIEMERMAGLFFDAKHSAPRGYLTGVILDGAVPRGQWGYCQH